MEKWENENKEKRKKQARLWKRRNPERVRKARLKCYEKMCEKLFRLIGDKCIVCGQIRHKPHNKLEFHEKNGVNHRNENRFKYIRKNKENFMPLCHRCHQIVHRIAEASLNIEQTLKAQHISTQLS